MCSFIQFPLSSMHPSVRWRFCAIVALLAFVLVYLRRGYYSADARASKNKHEKVGLPEMLRLLTTENVYARTLEKVCLKEGTCVEIRDVIERTGDKHQSRREIVSKNLKLSSMDLIPPEDITLNDLDTSQWKLDKGAHNVNKSALAMIEEMFLSGALDMDKETEARVLLLGLAGGYVNSYLHYHFPKMDITVVEVDRKMVKVAKKWFGLTLDAKQHVVVEDANQFIKEAAEQEDKYDVILVDVCAAEKEALCPLKSAINTDTAETLSSILNEEGALIVNVFSTSSGTSNVGENLKSHYEHVFNGCSLRRVSNDNLVMTCIQHERPKGLEEAYSSFMEYEKPNVVLI